MRWHEARLEQAGRNRACEARALQILAADSRHYMFASSRMVCAARNNQMGIAIIWSACVVCSLRLLLSSADLVGSSRQLISFAHVVCSYSLLSSSVHPVC